MKTKAAILVEQNKPLVIDEVEIPKLDYGQVLVKVNASRICGSQLGEIAGVKGEDKWLPHLLGHEGHGTVLETGPGVTRLKVDDSAVLHWRPASGIEARPPKYQWGYKTVNAGWITTFNSYAIISENRMTPIAHTVDPEIACLMADTITTGFGLINNDAQVKIGESVVIVGCGGIGLGAILGAKLAGAHPIVAIDLHDHKLEKAAKHGATHVFNSSEKDAKSFLKGLLPSGADVAVDCTGNPKIIEMVYESTHPKGRSVLLGVMRFDQKIALHTLPLHFGRLLTGSEGGASQPEKEIPRYLKMIEGGLFDPSDFVTHRGSLDDVNTLIEKMKSGEVIHSILHFEDKKKDS